MCMTLNFSLAPLQNRPFDYFLRLKLTLWYIFFVLLIRISASLEEKKGNSLATIMKIHYNRDFGNKQNIL